MDWDSDFTCPPVRGHPALSLPADALRARPNEVTVADFGLFRDVLNRHFYPATVSPVDAHPRMAAPRLSAVHLSLSTIAYVRFGTTASVDPGDLSAYHVNVPLHGLVVSRCGEQETVASPQVAAVFSPGRHTFLPRWEADAAQLCIKLDRYAVERELADLLRDPAPRPVSFDLAFPLVSGPGRQWLSILSALLQFADAAPAPLQVIESLERSLISGLLVSQSHSLTDNLQGGSARRVPRAAVDAVVEAMESAPDRAYSLGDLSRLSGLSARSLQYAFQERYGMSPMRYLRRVRLERARQDLRQTNGSVAEVASYWGFSNLGRFARAYYERFGEFPSVTRRPDRGRHRNLPA